MDIGLWAASRLPPRGPAERGFLKPPLAVLWSIADPSLYGENPSDRLPELAGSGWLVEFSLDGEPLRAVGVSTDEAAHDVAQEYVDTGQGDRDTL